jgi:hypothetical protein
LAAYVRFARYAARMAGASQTGDHSSAAWGNGDAETRDLIAQIRELSAGDSQAVHQIVAEVLAALDRVTGKAYGAADQQRGEVGPDAHPTSTT